MKSDFRIRYLQAGITLPYNTYMFMMFLLPLLTFSFGFIISLLLITYYSMPVFVLFFPVFASSCIFVLLFLHPYDKRRSRKQNIDTNLPYALSYMASIAETGVSPVSMFEAIASFDEYEEVSREAASMIKQVKYLGKDLLSVLQAQSDRTPSEDLKQTLKGMVSVLHAGGNIASYFRQKYNDIMFRKILKESEYEKSLDVHENLFTTLLVVAPLLFFTFVMLGQMISPGASDAVMLLRLLTYVFMPIANIGFIMLLKLSRD